jgi:NADH:ubiquinone oxidoreductase subunit 6 (subunit J)
MEEAKEVNKMAKGNMNLFILIILSLISYSFFFILKSKKIVKSLLSLITIYLFLTVILFNIKFIFNSLIIILLYIGAVAVFFIFVLMTTKIIEKEFAFSQWNQKFFNFLLSFRFSGKGSGQWNQGDSRLLPSINDKQIHNGKNSLQPMETKSIGRPRINIILFCSIFLFLGLWVRFPILAVGWPSFGNTETQSFLASGWLQAGVQPIQVPHNFSHNIIDYQDNINIISKLIYLHFNYELIIIALLLSAAAIGGMYFCENSRPMITSPEIR